ncbi:MAG: hypothetical protein R2798_05025 [Chitinophagales bacterium]|nr:hypothetical protein [Bacteroidota bacterium]MCB9042724.1 hypothetical protein [Chitinophagales bacterium]
MKALKTFFFLLILLGSSILSAQTNPPATITEIRYWQDMTKMGNNDVMVDTMIYYGNDRAGFAYANAKCVSYHCKDTDSLIYSLLPKLYTPETEWTLGSSIIRKMSQKNITFQGFNQTVNKVYVSDLANKTSGIGDYSLVTKDFGVICRWNADGEFFQLIRIDIVRNGKLEKELDILPLFDSIYSSGIFNASN